jgi:hypothetical protein
VLVERIVGKDAIQFGKQRGVGLVVRRSGGASVSSAAAERTVVSESEHAASFSRRFLASVARK